VSDGHSFLEAPRWHDGRLYASDFYTGQVLCWDGAGAPRTVCEVPAQPSGLGWTARGELLVVSMIDRRLLRLGPDGLVEVADLSAHAPWHCNDMVVDDAGGAYIGNLGWDDETDPVIRSTRLLRVDPDGAVEVVAEELVGPNGMVITASGDTLLVCETFAARITAFDRARDGTLSGRRVWAAFTDEELATIPQALAAGVILPDGIALDADGGVWLGDCRGSGASRVAEGGKVLDFVPTGDLATFAVALGGSDRRTLYLCAGTPYGSGDSSLGDTGAMLSRRVDVPGAGRP
jgi:sugar lactone lactonase YvrE